MRPSLWLKLMGILAVIVATGAVVLFVAINLTTATQFRRFVLTSDLVQAQTLSNLLARYYARQGDWQGVESFLGTGVPIQSERMNGMMGSGNWMMGPGMMRPTNMRPDMMPEMWEMMRARGSLLDRVVLADAAGVVIADSADTLAGQRLPGPQIKEGVPIVFEGQNVGSVLVGSMIEPVLTPLDQDFLRSVNLAVLLSAITVAVVALVLGSLFFLHITAPVSSLTRAAEAITAGDLSQRVPVHTGDEIGRLALAFNTMAGALDRAETLRRQMVADIAHELRTPLSLMQGNLEAILDGMYEINMENVASVHEETLVLTRLVNDLRDLSLAEAGQLPLEQDRVDLADLAARAAESFRSQASEQGITLVVDLPAGLPPVRGDAQRLNQVLINLLSNALRHTPGGGRVVVSAGQDSGGMDGHLRISVADTGQGIPAEDLPFVFERFYRADKSRVRASGGSGLGLAIARQIVQAHGGRIWAESRPGVGSTFFFTLPANQ